MASQCRCAASGTGHSCGVSLCIAPGRAAPAQEVGPLDAPFSVGVDRAKAVAGPDRVVTDASLLRKDFSLGSGIRSARLTVTALGAYEGWLNGKRVAPQTVLAPGFTDFHK